MATAKIGIREFRAGLADYIASDTAVAITRHGHTVGYFIPARGQVEADLASLKKAAAELDRLLASRSVNVEEVAAEYSVARKTALNQRRKSSSRTKKT